MLALTPSVQSPRAYDLANLTRAGLVTRLADSGYRYKIHPLETAAGLSEDDLIFGYDYGHLRRYGAELDGATDDTTAVQAAIDSTAGESRVFHPGGVCIVEALDVPSETVFEGLGAYSLYRLKSGASSPQIVDADTVDDLVFSGVGFDCNNVTSGVALNLDTVTNTRVQGCYFTSKYGVYCIGAYDGIHVEQSFFDANNYALIAHPASTGKNVTACANRFQNVTADAIEINVPTAGSAKNWAIFGNVFDTIGSNAVGSGFGVGMSGSSNYIDGVSVFGNTFLRCDHQAVHIEDGSRNVAVTGNSIKDTGYGGTQSLIAGIYIAASAGGREIRGVVATGNVIDGVADMDYGIYAAGSVSLYGVKLDANTVQNALLYGVLLGSVLRGYSCSNNLVYDSTGPGIRVAGQKGSISGNVCTVLLGTQTYGMEFNTGTDLVITDNVLTGNDTGPVLVTSGLTTSIVRHNRGWVTEANGNPTITSGSTSVVVTHGLSVTPSAKDIFVMANNNPDNAVGSLWVSTITATQFTINCENNPGASGLSLVWSHRLT